VERYWPLALLFRVRQATLLDNKDPVVMRLIRKEQGRLMFRDTMSAHKYRRRYPADYKGLIALSLGRPLTMSFLDLTRCIKG
jgi:hypothetical protein